MQTLQTDLLDVLKRVPRSTTNTVGRPRAPSAVTGYRLTRTPPLLAPAGRPSPVARPAE